MPDTASVTLANGTTITLRRPTEEEAVAFAEKRQRATSADEKIADYLNNGADEVLACLVTPDKAAVLALLDDYPALTIDLFGLLRKAGGDDTAVEDVAITEDEKTARPGVRMLALEVGAVAGDPLADPVVSVAGERVLLRKMTRIEYEFFAQSHKGQRRIPVPDLVRIAKSHILSHSEEQQKDLFARLPFLSADLGHILYKACSIKVQATEGK